MGNAQALNLEDVKLEERPQTVKEIMDKKQPIDDGLPKMGKGAEFQKHACFGTCFGSLRKFVNVIGAFAALINVILDIFYAYTTTYMIKMIFLITCGLILVRIIVIFLVGQCYYRKFVRNYRPNLSHAVEEKDAEDEDQVSQDESGNTDSKKYSELMNQGQNLYASLHLLFYTGFYRLLPSKDFSYELFSGYSIELCLSILPMFFCQVFNNANSERLTFL